MSLNTNDLLAILPFLILVAWAILLIVADLFIPRERKGIMALLTGIGLLVALGFAVARVGGQTVAFNGMIVYDGFAVFLTVLFLGSGLAAVALSYDYLQRHGDRPQRILYPAPLFDQRDDADVDGSRSDPGLHGAGIALHTSLRAGWVCLAAPGLLRKPL